MADIVLRLVKGIPLTDPEMDANFTNLNRDSFLSVKNSIPWVANTVVSRGETLNISDRYYYVLLGGTTGSTVPSHTSGTVTNGTAQLTAAQVASYSARDVMAKVQQLHGTGSGLDADLLDGLNSISVLPSTTDKSSIVSRDAQGNFFANVITATLNGTASSALTATTATTATNVNGGTASVSTLTVSGDATVGSSASNNFNINSKINVGGGVGTSGQFLMSRGNTQTPQWTSISTLPTLTDDNSNSTRFIVFADGTGTQSLKVDASVTGLTYNPFTNTVDANVSGTSYSVSGGTANVTSINNTGDTTLGNNGTDFTTVNSQLVAANGAGTNGQVLASRGPNLSPQWITPETTLSNNHIGFNGAVYSTVLAVPPGTWAIYVWWRYHHVSFIPSQLYIDGVMVDALPNRGDPEGQNHFNLFGSNVITGGRNVTITGGGGTTSDLRLMVQGFRIG